MHVRDILSAEGADFTDSRELSAPARWHRSILSVPLLREDESIGAIVLRRTEVHPFSDKQIALLQTFADQAVIAIGNVRLFEEVQAKTRDLTESLEQQTATSEVLEVISASTGELEPVFQKMLENATRVCGANFGTMNLLDGDSYQIVRALQRAARVRRALRGNRYDLIRKAALAMATRTQASLQVEDIGPASLSRRRSRRCRDFRSRRGEDRCQCPDAPGKRTDRHHHDLPTGSAAVHRQADRAC